MFETASSHLYPGSLLHGPTLPLEERFGLGQRHCLIAFGDGAQATGRIEESAGSLQLHMDDYVTARGTAIGARRWQLELKSPQVLKVRARISIG